jgi:hypothetical protein
MSRIILLLALLGAAPDEACDMANRPVNFPGAQLSRNSQIRNSALQAGAFATPDPGTIRPPTTVPDDIAIQFGNPGATAGRVYFARLKWDQRIDYQIQRFGCSVSNQDATPKKVGNALYRFSIDNGVATFSLIGGGFQLLPVGGFSSPSAVWPTGYTLDRNSQYIGAFYTETAVLGDTEYVIGNVAAPAFLVANDITGGGVAWPQTVTPTADGSVTFLSTRAFRMNAVPLAGYVEDLLFFY